MKDVMQKILFVEDDELVLASSTEMMRDLGHIVVQSRNGEDAMNFLQQISFDVLVADIGLSGLSGDVLAAEARGLQPNLRIVFATGTDILRGAGKDGFGPVVLRKPYDSAAIAAALQIAV